MSNSDKNMVQALNSALRYEMRENENILLFGQDVGVSGGVFRVSEGLKEEFGDDRVFDTPLSETAIVGAAIGLSSFGFRPIAEIQFSGFLPIALNQIMEIGSRMRWRTRGEFTAPMVIRTPFGAGVRAPEHHSESDEAMYAHIPGLKVVIPSNPRSAYGLLLAAIRDPDPVLFLEPKRLYRSETGSFPESGEEMELSKANIVREGSDITIITWGSMVKPVKEVHENISPEISVEVIDLLTISPYDQDTVIESVKKTGRVVIVHEASKTGGFGAEISAQINSEALIYLDAPIKRITGFDTPPPLFSMEDYYLPNPARIEEGVRKCYNYE